MRQLATLPTAAAARALADYLLTRKIDTRLLPDGDQWSVWVCDEDRLPQAQLELAEFERNPHDTRFTEAAKAAEVVRQQQRRAESAPLRGPKVRRPSDIGAQHPVTATLIALSILATLATDWGKIHLPPSNFATSLTDKLLIASPWDVVRARPADPLLSALRKGQVWRLVTPVFVHLTLLHLLFDMVMLYQLGSRVEQRRGPWRYLLLILVCAITSNLGEYYLGHMVWDGDGLRFSHFISFGGMSGVVYGVFGYFWMKAHFEPELELYLPPSTVFYLMVWFFACTSEWFQKEVLHGNIANWAHGVGLLSGIFIGVAPTVGRVLFGGLRRDR
jgi:GlpG protein